MVRAWGTPATMGKDYWPGRLVAPWGQERHGLDWREQPLTLQFRNYPKKFLREGLRSLRCFPGITFERGLPHR